MNRSTYTTITNHMMTKSALIYILNCTDMLFTYTFLKTGGFYEANFFMQTIVSNPYLGILVKIICPAIIIMYLISALKTQYTEHIRLSNLFVNFLLLIYTSINILHLYYTANILLSLTL